MDDELDRRLKTLVADAVSATPPPPALEPVYGASLRPGARSRWTPTMVTAAVGLAAAAIAVFIVVRREDREVRTIDSTVVSTSTTTTSATSTVPTSDAATTVDPSATTAPASIAAQVVPTTAVPLAVYSEAVSAGPDGVWIERPVGREQWTTERMDNAVRLPDGRMIMQRRAGVSVEGSWTAADTELLVQSSPGAALEPLFPNHSWGREAWIVLHDATVVDGHPTLLVELASMDSNIEARPGVLMVKRLTDGREYVLDDNFGGWEEGSGRMHLASNGVVVGEKFGGISASLVTYHYNGTVTLLTAADLGVEPTYEDCGYACPHTFTISKDGSTYAWLDGTSLVRFAVATRTRSTTEVGPLANAFVLDVGNDTAVFGLSSASPSGSDWSLIRLGADGSIVDQVLLVGAGSAGVAPA